MDYTERDELVTRQFLMKKFAVAYMVVDTSGNHQVHITTVHARNWEEFYRITPDHIRALHSTDKGYSHHTFIGKEV